MEQIPTPKKERKFLKAIVRVAGVLVQELALGLGRKYIGKMINKIKIPKKRETLSFLLLLFCTIAFAQYPATGNKQRLGYQSTGDGLVFRGRSNDTTALKPSTLNNAYHLFDTVNNVLFSYIKTKGGWKFNNSDTVIINNTIDTTSLDSRINLKLNISDTSFMLTNYLRTGVAASTYQTKLNGSGFVKASGTTITYDNSTYLTSSTGVTTFSAASTGLTPSTATSGAITLGGTLAITNGGTGATSASAARTALGATVRGANTFLLTDIGAISFLRYNADNTVSQRAADGMRSDLGGTTIGQSMFTLTNPSAITFPRFNADNTVTALDATSFRTAIGAGTGTGTVTSVTGSLPISSSGGTTPNITIANAAVSTTGVVTASTQTFGGAKTFNGVLNASSDLNVTGIASLNGGVIISPAGSMTKIAGLNVSNAIGSITVGSGLSLSSGTLTATAGNDINTYLAINGPGIELSSSFGTATFWYVNINQNSTVTITLPSASGNVYKTLVIKNSGSGAVNSNATNVEPLNSTSLGTAIMTSGGGKYATLVSNGTNWIKMSGN
jgi:hypothetical protein